MAQKFQKIAQQQTEELLAKLGIKASVVTTDESETTKVTINGENLGVLIGYHGQTLESFQLILSLMVNNQVKSDSWQRLVVDVGEYRAERENTLKEIVNRAVEDLEVNGKKETSLPVMTPSERRAAHLIVSENYPELETISEGEEPYRRIKLLKK